MRSLRRSMGDFLDLLAIAARESIASGYYQRRIALEEDVKRGRRSLRDAIVRCMKAAIISEVKFASPSIGVVRIDRSVETISRDMAEAGAIGISVLTESRYFYGSLDNLARARLTVDIPVLMKDIILSRCQIDAAYRLGADAILLIMALFRRGYCEIGVDEMIDYSHSMGLEVLLETHDAEEFKLALKTEADMIGINNRDLKTLKVDINTTRIILEKFRRSDIGGRPIVSESGIKSPEDILFLRRCGADAFLVGSTVMSAKDIKDFVKHLVNAYDKSRII
ncbi:MAG: indole-3-glycerol-phosphate synthase [Candidatus Bathyarchaeota archaeon]|nr:indole-3-glycerol-phosphate synthase [Candidatus Bathyarchaeota archaeon]